MLEIKTFYTYKNIYEMKIVIMEICQFFNIS